MASETVTVVEVTAVTIVPPAMEDPETSIPISTPVVSAKCRTTRSPSASAVAAESVFSENDAPDALARPSLPVRPMNDTTVPAGT